jgi:hypothetical protein
MSDLLVAYVHYRRKPHICTPLQEVSAYGYMLGSDLYLPPSSLRKVGFLVGFTLGEWKE